MDSLKTERFHQLITRAALSYSARRYDSAVCCSKMSRDAYLSEALYEADKALEKFAWKVCCSDAGVCVLIRWWMEQTVHCKCMFYFVILRSTSTNSLHLCRLLHCCKPLSKSAARPLSANLQRWVPNAAQQMHKDVLQHQPNQCACNRWLKCIRLFTKWNEAGSTFRSVNDRDESWSAAEHVWTCQRSISAKQHV